MSKKQIYIFLLLLVSAIVGTLFNSCNSTLNLDSSKTNLPEVVDFNFHVKPILSDRCYSCHGPDENSRKAELRLDVEEEAFAKLVTGRGRAFHKNSPSKSVAIQRMKSDDPEFQMPPPESNLTMSDYEIALIEKWVDQGGEWKKHWSFIPPQKSKIPNVETPIWSNTNELDQFILEKAMQRDLEVSPEADPERLLRRLYMDLTGLPPSVEAIDAYVSNPSFEHYETIVDQLLTTESHAERMTMEWLDVSRYADSHGLHADGWRNMSPWRDWVIDAFKSNLSYTEFIRKQVAGDMLPNATKEDIIATAFNRNHPMTAEGGAIDEEWRLNYVFDRSETISTALLGLTVACAKCHDHKYDPISQKEYYEMAAFFNNVTEAGMTGDDGNYGPIIMLADDETQRKIDDLSAQIKAENEKIKLSDSELKELKSYISNKTLAKDQKLVAHVKFDQRSTMPQSAEKKWAKAYFDKNKKYTTIGDGKLVEGKYGQALLFEKDFSTMYLADAGQFELMDAYTVMAWINTVKNDPKKTQTIIGNSGEKNNYWRGWDLYLDEENRLNARLISALPHNYIHIRSSEQIDTAEWVHTAVSYDGSENAQGLSLYINGLKSNTEIMHNDLSKSTLTIKSASHIRDNRSIAVGVSGRLYTGEDGLFYGRIDDIKVFEEALSVYEIKKAAGLESEIDESSQYQIAERRHFKKEKENLKTLRTEKLKLMSEVDEMMVMKENHEPGKMYIYDRGEYDKPTVEVTSNTVSAVLPFPSDVKKDRLGLVDWIFDEDNPLTDRVAVNRYWQMIYGQGIVATPEDFGMQGSLPSHPELLDWLAVDFRENGRDVRRLLKQMVLSATYRQSSIATEELREVDPNNIYLARGSSYRLSAEMIRDNALAASGLLTRRVGGESVRPYQPEGLWIEMGNFSYKLLRYKEQKGDSLYRRSMYTFVRRTSPPPMMTTFDMPSREVCVMKRESTSTPLQALVLMNDPQFIEAAKVMAQRMQYEGGESAVDQINFAFKSCTGRSLSDEEMAVFSRLYKENIEKFSANPSDATKLLSVGEYVVDESLDKVKTAALAMVSNTMLNHDDSYMKR